MSGSNCHVLRIRHTDFRKRQRRWSGVPISLRIFQFVVIHTVKGFHVVNEAEVYVFSEIPLLSL